MTSGAGALIHQLCWTRRLIDLLGASHESVARVVGCFFLGLALGAALAARSLPRVNRPWRWVAGVDAAVIALSLPALFLPYWTQWIWPALGVEALTGWPGSWTKFALSIAVVLPPATAMGMTLPFLGVAVLRDQATLGRQGLWIYALNTLGGVCGLALAISWFLHAWGAAGTMWAAIGFSGIVVALALYADRRAPELRSLNNETTVTDSSPPGQAARSARRGSFGLAFGSGFALLAYEVSVIQAVTLHAPLSFYAPAVVLMVLIAWLAIGAAVTPWLLRRCGGAPDRLLRWALLGAGAGTVLSPLWLTGWTTRLTAIAPLGSFYGWLGEMVLWVTLALGPGLFFAALLFPATLAWLSGAGQDPHGRRWGVWLAANGVGGWLGAECAYRFLLPWGGPYWTIGVVGLGYAVAALMWTGAHTKGRGWPFPVTAAVTGVALLLVGFRLPDLPLVDTHGRLSVVAERTGREGTVAVVDVADGGRSLLMANQYVLGSTASAAAQERQAHLPLLLHPNPQRVATIGIATGITPGAALRHPPVEHLTAIELSPLVTELAEGYFAPYQHGLFADQRVRIQVEDGRTFMAASVDEFDVVLGDLFLPWGPGEARLYASEHFAAVKRALRSGGLFAQWLAMYQLTPDQFEIIAATFQRIFPTTYVVISEFGPYPAVGLIGFRDTDWDWAVVDARLRQTRATGWDDPLLRTVYAVRMLSIGVLDDLSSRPVNTLDNMRIELAAGRLHITSDPAQTYLFGRRWMEWLDQAPVRSPER